jgi:hypothetical protein
MAVNPLLKQRKRHKPGPGRPFQKGQSGNPAGRPVGSRNRATQVAEAILDDNAEGIITPFDAAEMARLVETALRAAGIGDFERRLAELEREVEGARMEHDDASPA